MNTETTTQPQYHYVADMSLGFNLNLNHRKEKQFHSQCSAIAECVVGERFEIKEVITVRYYKGTGMMGSWKCCVWIDGHGSGSAIANSRDEAFIGALRSCGVTFKMTTVPPMKAVLLEVVRFMGFNFKLFVSAGG